MGFRPLTPEEQAAHENSLRKIAGAPAAPPAPVVVAAPAAAVNDQITDSVTAAAPEAVEATEGEAQEAKPAGKNPFKKKG
jgi:hypothetical protein